MYVVEPLEFGEAMKAKTIKEIKSWWITNEVDAAIKWKELKKEGHTLSICEKWKLYKEDAKDCQRLHYISSYALLSPYALIRI